MFTIHRSGSPLGGPPRDLVALDRAGDRPRSAAASSGRSAGRRHRGRDVGVVAQRPDLLLAGDREPVGADRDAHGVVEPAEGEGQLPVGHADGDQLSGLVRRDEQRAARLLEHARERRAVLEADLGRRAGVGRGHRSFSVNVRTTLLDAPPHGVKVNRARTCELAGARRSVRSPARVGLEHERRSTAWPRRGLADRPLELRAAAGATSSRPAPSATTPHAQRAVARCRASPCSRPRTRPATLMSSTSAVPAAVPSEVHSSRPWTPSSAPKNSSSADGGQPCGPL